MTCFYGSTFPLIKSIFPFPESLSICTNVRKPRDSKRKRKFCLSKHKSQKKWDFFPLNEDQIPKVIISSRLLCPPMYLTVRRRKKVKAHPTNIYVAIRTRRSRCIYVALSYKEVGDKL